MLGRYDTQAATIAPATNGIGAMNAVRIKDFYDNMVRAGLYKAGDVDLRRWRS